MERETPLGTLIATPTGDAAHPGIWIELRTKEGRNLPLTLVECVDDEVDIQSDRAYLVTRVWANTQADEYTDRIIHEGL